LKERNSLPFPEIGKAEPTEGKSGILRRKRMNGLSDIGSGIQFLHKGRGK
jgi:hypothetical protein